MPRDVAWNAMEDAVLDWPAPRGAGQIGTEKGELRPTRSAPVRGCGTPPDRRPVTLLQARFALSGLISAIENPDTPREALRELALDLSVSLRRMAA